jgi:hypothetical protein
MELQLIITIILIGYLRKSLAMPLSMPQWNRRFWWMMYAAIALLALHFSYHGADAVTQWLALFLLSGLIYIIHDNEEFKKTSFLVTAVLPYLVVSAVIYIGKYFTSDNEDLNQWL